MIAHSFKNVFFFPFYLVIHLRLKCVLWLLFKCFILFLYLFVFILLCVELFFRHFIFFRLITPSLSKKTKTKSLTIFICYVFLCSSYFYAVFLLLLLMLLFVSFRLVPPDYFEFTTLIGNIDDTYVFH